MSLNETAGLNAGPGSTDISIFTVDGITPIYIPTNGSPIDWNQNGDTTETNVKQDINGDGATTLLTGSNDWANLNFYFQATTNFADAEPPPFWLRGVTRSLVRRPPAKRDAPSARADCPP
jgi:hypothetical protein